MRLVDEPKVYAIYVQPILSAFLLSAFLRTKNPILNFFEFRVIFLNGVSEGAWTLDIQDHNLALYQLNYIHRNKLSLTSRTWTIFQHFFATNMQIFYNQALGQFLSDIL